jgi:excinuclease ABC subunit C
MSKLSLKDKVNKLPDDPGVYFFLDKDDNILYIGKATSLKNRVRSYFDKDINIKRGGKIQRMMILADNIKIKKTDSVLEALMLENILIKKHNPPYNTKEKDDKSYQIVVITKEDFPRVLTMRVREYEKRFLTSDDTLKDSEVFGPFTCGAQLREALKIIRKIFPFRDKCEIYNKEHNLKCCFNYSLGLCPGSCCGKISKEEYKKNIKYIKMIFSGKQKSIVQDLQKEMVSRADNQDFEQAAKIRNTIYALKHIRDITLIKDQSLQDWVEDINHKKFRIEGYDVAHISGSNRVGVMVVVEDGVPNKKEYRTFKLKEGINDDYAGIEEMLRRRFGHLEWQIPDLIVFDGGIGQKNIGDKVLLSLGFGNIDTCSVVKDDKHKPKDIISNTKIGDKKFVNKAILLTNNEAHRFAIKYHKKLRETIK